MNDALKVRPMVPGADDEAYLEIRNRIATEVPDALPISREQLEASRKTPGYDPHGHFVAEWKESIVGTGFGHVSLDDPDRKGFFQANVLPEFRRRHIGTALADAVIRDLRERGIAKVTSQTREGNVMGNAFLQSLGFKVCWVESRMRRSLDQLPAGAGEDAPVEIRLLGISDDDVQLIVSLMNEIFKGTRDFQPMKFEQQRYWVDRLQAEGRTMWWFVARLGSDPIGLICAMFDPGTFAQLKKKRATLMSLGVLEAHRGQGIGKALLTRSMQALKDKGIEEADLVVDDENPVPAIQIYLRLGFQVIRKILTYERAV
jgi:ribosomal protein S18 acetylase RimI-like enzyme